MGLFKKVKRSKKRRGRGALVYDDRENLRRLSDLFYIFISFFFVGLYCLAIIASVVWLSFFVALALSFIALIVVVVAIMVLVLSRATPIVVYERGIELGTAGFPRFYEFSKIKKIQVNADKKEVVKEVVLFFRTGTTYILSERTNADYVSKDVLPLLGVMLKQIAVYENEFPKKPKSKIEFKNIEPFLWS